jgi:hypothetical protein
MCCFFLATGFFGPRLGFLVYWLFYPGRVNAALDTFILPLLGLIFLPWTTLMYVIVAQGGMVGFDWVWVGLAAAVDIATYGASAAKRKTVPGYPSTAP